MTSATDNRTTELLRKLLDERGVEWVEDVPYGAKAITKFKSNGVWLRYVDYDDCQYGNYQWLDYHENEPLTPEQAIAATLGSGTCEPNWVLQGETQTQEFWRCECGNCGECFGVETRESFPLKMTIDKVDVPNFCPNCGKRIRKKVDE